MVTVQTSPLSPRSPLHANLQPGDFVDCFSVRSSLHARDAAAVITDFPAWVQSLMQLRNILVRPFGLLPEAPGIGPKIGPFPVTHETEDEVIAGFDDRHLDFRVSIRSENGRVSLATWVHPHNIGGRAYLSLIMPFHVAIARNAVARAGTH